MPGSDQAFRSLVVNADDFGRSSGVNLGIITAYECGIVTSASLMVRWPAATEAARYARAHPALSLGLHVDLGEWVYRNDEWCVHYQVVDTADAKAVAHEIDRQLATFRELIGTSPTHLDSHQHVHRSEPVRGLLLERARALGVPLRECTPGIWYYGEFYGQSSRGDPYPDGVSVEALAGRLHSLPPGLTELACHPGLIDDHDELDSPYGIERNQELRTLCDSRIRAAIADEGLRLRSFHGIGHAP